MESVFGELPSGGLSGSVNNDYMAQEPQFSSHGLTSSTSNNYLAEAQESQSVYQNVNQNAPALTHVGSTGEAQMVDVSPKEASKRTAIASCKVILGKKVFDLVSANQMAKGDVLTVAKIAGINGAKHTSSLIPLCHNITLTRVRVDLILNPNDYSVEIEGEAASTGKTGVEMEALTAVTTAGLTVYDMCKAASKQIQITEVQLESKTGGKSGVWNRKLAIPINMSIKNEREPTKDKKLRRFILLTLRHIERLNLPESMVIERVSSCFTCRSIVVATEKQSEGGLCFRVGIVTTDAMSDTAKKRLKSKFMEFEESQFFVKFHKGWGKICEIITEQDKHPSVWGHYALEEILELGRASRYHRRIQMERSSSC